MISDEELEKTLDPHDEKLHYIGDEAYVMYDRISGNPKLLHKSAWTKDWDKPVWPAIKSTALLLLQHQFSSIKFSTTPYGDIEREREDIKCWGSLSNLPILTDEDVDNKLQENIDRHHSLANQFSKAHDLAFEQIRKMSFMEYRRKIGAEGRKCAIEGAVNCLTANMS